MSHISTGKASWVHNGEIDPSFLEHGAKQERRISHELIRPPMISVPHLHWLDVDDDVVDKMIRRGILASPSEPRGV